MTLALELAGGSTVAALSAWLAHHWHRRHHYARTLANIARLERELGIVEDPVTAAMRHQLGGVVDTAPMPVQRYGGPYARVAQSTPAVGYQGPALTDADVRRQEHPQEFER